ncbi:Pkinase-domain-containing protein, partial [Caulochytrium protostelioides]
MLSAGRPTGPGHEGHWQVHQPNKPKGRLVVQVLEARNLLVPPSSAHRPYCVVEFEKNECLTPEAHPSKPGRPDAASCPVWHQETIFDVVRPDGEVMLTLWSRASRVGDEEHFLGMMRVRPPHIAEKVHDNWFRLLPRVWRERVKGEIHLRIKYIPAAPAAAPMQASDFEVLKMLGKGNFGKVLQVRKKDTGRIYAMKILIKKDVVEKREVQHTLSERNVLIQATSPFLVGLKFAFQTPEKLYLVLDFMNGGELFYHLQSETAFSESRARFYTAELISAIAHLHRYNIIYRDLKPENILLDSNGHIALTDFGLCKENISADKITNTFCGTAEYLAPEVLLGRGYGKPVDWWSLGILFYEMTTGLPPFFSENTNMMFKKILHAEVTYPA